MAKLYFKYGVMNAGKSLALLYMANLLREQGRTPLIFTSSLDTRSGPGMVSSRTGMSAPAKSFDVDTDFVALAADFASVDCLLLDEAQFLTRAQVHDLHRLAVLRDITVMAFGLRSDFRSEAFPGSAALLLLADEITEIKAHCACGHRASFNVRLNQNLPPNLAPQILIGGSEAYKSICARCHYGNLE
jgi:thymidine kinase